MTFVYVCVLSRSVMSDSLWPHGPLSMSPSGSPGSFTHWDSADKNIGVGCHDLLHSIFPNQGWNPRLPHCRQILYIWTTREAQEYWSGQLLSFLRGSFRPKNWTGVSCIAGRFFTNWATREVSFCGYWITFQP